MGYEENVNNLAPLETFDPAVFRSDEHTPQSLCDFILALALVHNDFHDILLAHVLLNELQAESGNIITPRTGLQNGLKNTTVRIQIGFVRELLNLLTENRNILECPSFRGLQKSLSKHGKQSWASLVSVATESSRPDSLAKVLIVIRNKIAFHYDPKQLGQGFTAAFLSKSAYGKPLISRGSVMRDTRFFFADAAAQQYMRSKATQQPIIDFLSGQGDLIQDLNQAIFELVTRFINSRSPWQLFKVGA
jgi:hypothetical protein